MATTPSFRIRSYGFQELAQLYSPGITPDSAYRRLYRWVNHSPELYKALCRAGWKKGNRVLRPRQVRVLVEHLGEP